MSIADVFDALTTNRSYAFAQKPFKAMKIMLKEMNGRFEMNLFFGFQYIGSVALYLYIW